MWIFRKCDVGPWTGSIGTGGGTCECGNEPSGSINLLKPNDIYIRRTAALTSRRYILNIYSTNIHTEYFKHAA